MFLPMNSVLTPVIKYSQFDPILILTRHKRNVSMKVYYLRTSRNFRPFEFIEPTSFEYKNFPLL